MSSEIKKAIAISASIFIVLMGYYGSYLPMRKSMIFISSVKDANGARSVTDLEKAFSAALDYPSPIGQQELVRSVANTIVNNLQSISQKDALAELVRYIESYYEPIIARGTGMSFSQDVYILGMINEISYIRTGDQKYLQAAEKYYKEGQVLGPKRPQSLYGLIDVYRMEGKMDEFKKVADQVLSQWPDDSRTKNIIDQALKQFPATKTGK